MEKTVSQRVARQKKGINDVLNFIRANRTKSLQLDELAQIACMSPYHFHRIFNACVGESVRQHIQRVRLEQAALRLRGKNEHISDISNSTGYRSHAAFSRAFTQHFGVNPTEYKNEIAAQLPTQREIQEVDAALPTWRYVTCSPIAVIYVRRSGPYERAASDAWQALMQYAYANNLVNETTRHIGITYDSPDVTLEEHIQYDACLTTTITRPDGEVCTQIIAGGRYAMFEHVGPYETLWRTYDAIYGEWLMKCADTLADVPSFAVYPDTQSSSEPSTEPIQIYVPITT